MKTLKYLLSIVSIVIVSLVFILGGCFSPFTGPSGDKGTLSINLGGGGDARTLVDIDREPGILRYDVLLSGPEGQTQNESFSGQTAASFRLVPGEWRITVKAWGYRNGVQANSQDKNVLRAMGSQTVKIDTGKTSSVTVSMITVTEVNTWAELISAADGAYAAGQQGREEIIYIRDDLGAGSGPVMVRRNITLIAEEETAITRDSYTGALFMINSGGSLKLGQPGMAGTLTISGGDHYADPLISLTGGELELFDGVTLKDSHYNDIDDSPVGSAINITTSGKFTMHGGEISGNTGYHGGAVSVFDNGTFVMNGGEISGNEGAGGGGVFIGNGTFNMHGGTISDNNAVGERGGGIYINTAGNFTMSGGEISGNTCGGDNVGSSGIYHEGELFDLSGDVRIEDNNIYLGENGQTIKVSGVLTNVKPMKIVLDSYSPGTRILAEGFPAGSESKFEIEEGSVFCIGAEGLLVWGPDGPPPS